ncbi:MAG: C1 family peptidase [Bacteroidota bacterium]|nr:C1 family peptidase [Bacteroidota bacterium]
MNKFLLSVLLTIPTLATAQKYEFQTKNQIECTPVTSQDRTGTCWSFATTSFLEAEIIRVTGKKIDLSEMYQVRNTFSEKIENYMMRQGGTQFSQGALAHDVINSVALHGLVPHTSFIGKENDSDKYNHDTLEAILKSMLEVFTKKPEAATNWKKATESILDIYIGKNPTEFVFENKKYTPKSFLAYSKINPNDYVSVTSFTHKPFYSKFILNIPDNFSNGSFYNIPIDELIENIDYALGKGFTIALDCDVSEVGFSAKEGIAVLPKNADDKDKKFLTEITEELSVTQESRQKEFEEFRTQDDHLMHIVGNIKDQKGNLYYIVKNSWGSTSERVGNEGYIYMSIPYTKMKTISILLHKDGLLAKTKKKLGL